MTRPMLIGLAAPARSGKDTVADIMVNKFKFKKHSLAAPIKDFFDVAFGWDMEHREGDLKEVEVTAVAVGLYKAIDTLFPGYNTELLVDKFNSVFDPFIVPGWECTYRISPRKAYQLFGTEFGRSISQTLWLDLAKRTYETLPTEFTGLVVPDIRFQNEADWIRTAGGTLIHIERNSEIKVASHVSEAGIDWEMQDYLIQNNGTKDDLTTAIFHVLSSIKGNIQ